ncbi:MAG: large conductance mechanosensitive channel protein MscL [Aquihabitans sp.]
MLQEFKKFIMKGNLVEIAVGLILALAFARVVEVFVEAIISPIIGAAFGVPSFADKTLEIGDGVIRYGAFIDVLIYFVIVAFVLFLIVKAYNAAREKFSKGPEAEPLADDIVLLTEIRDALKGRNPQV